MNYCCSRLTCRLTETCPRLTKTHSGLVFGRVLSKTLAVADLRDRITSSIRDSSEIEKEKQLSGSLDRSANPSSLSSPLWRMLSPLRSLSVKWSRYKRCQSITMLTAQKEHHRKLLNTLPYDFLNQNTDAGRDFENATRR